MKRAVSVAVVCLALAGCSLDASGFKDRGGGLPDRSNAKARTVSVKSDRVGLHGKAASVIGGLDIEPGRYAIKLESDGGEGGENADVRGPKDGDVPRNDTSTGSGGAPPGSGSGSAKGARWTGLSLHFANPDSPNLRPDNTRSVLVTREAIETSGNVIYETDIQKGEQVDIVGIEQEFEVTFEPASTSMRQRIPHAGDWVSGIDFEPGTYELATESSTVIYSVFSSKGAITHNGGRVGTADPMVVDLPKGSTLAYDPGPGTRENGMKVGLLLKEAPVAQLQRWSVGHSKGARGGTFVEADQPKVLKVGADLRPGYYTLDFTGLDKSDYFLLGIQVPGGFSPVGLTSSSLWQKSGKLRKVTVHLMEGQVLNVNLVRGKVGKKKTPARKPRLEFVPAGRPEMDISRLPPGIYAVGEDIPAGVYNVGGEDRFDRNLYVQEPLGLVEAYASRTRGKTQTVADLSLEEGQAVVVDSSRKTKLRPR